MKTPTYSIPKVDADATVGALADAGMRSILTCSITMAAGPQKPTTRCSTALGAAVRATWCDIAKPLHSAR